MTLRVHYLQFNKLEKSRGFCTTTTPSRLTEHIEMLEDQRSHWVKEAY